MVGPVVGVVVTLLKFGDVLMARLRGGHAKRALACRHWRKIGLVSSMLSVQSRHESLV